MISKRIVDLSLSLMGIILVFPLLILISFSIIVFMPGPVFFRQVRIGQKGRPFMLLKFRSMLSASVDKAGTFEAGNISRITPLGRFLRKYKLDELPQLVNVIRGDMSLVGPRPEVKKWTQVYPEKWEIVHAVKPGITDNASIEFRDEEEILAQAANPVETYKNEILPTKLDYYIKYVNNHSLTGDFGILIRTFYSIIN